jgi:hypothetical protein
MCQHACWYTLLPTQDCLSDLHLLKQKKWRGRSDVWDRNPRSGQQGAHGRCQAHPSPGTRDFAEMSVKNLASLVWCAVNCSLM